MRRSDAALDHVLLGRMQAAETLAAQRAGAVEPSQMRRVTVDTTAQTKAMPICQ